MDVDKSAVILVGHGGIPSDLPSGIVEKFMRLHKSRIKAGTEITSEEIELDNTIRKWERTPETDPYKSGLEDLATHMEPLLKNFILKTAYNEFCYPTIEQAIEELASTNNVSKIILVTTMITRGGSHSEQEIPEELEELRKKYNKIEIQYAWPFDIDTFALFMSTHVKIHDHLTVVDSK